MCLDTVSICPRNNPMMYGNMYNHGHYNRYYNQ